MQKHGHAGVSGKVGIGPAILRRGSSGQTVCFGGFSYTTSDYPAPTGTEGSSQPYSFHPENVNVVLGDDSVRSLSEDLDITIAAALVTRDSGREEATPGNNF